MSFWDEFFFEIQFGFTADDGAFIYTAETIWKKEIYVAEKFILTYDYKRLVMSKQKFIQRYCVYKVLKVVIAECDCLVRIAGTVICEHLFTWP